MSGIPHIGGFGAPAGADYAVFTYTGSNLTKVEYKQGGSSGVLLDTLNITYDGSNQVTTVYWSIS